MWCRAILANPGAAAVHASTNSFAWAMLTANDKPSQWCLTDQQHDGALSERRSDELDSMDSTWSLASLMEANHSS